MRSPTRLHTHTQNWGRRLRHHLMAMVMTVSVSVPLAFVNDSTALRVRLKPLEGGGAGRPMPGQGTEIVGSEAFRIIPMPNPFQQGLAFHISAPTATEARLSIFDARGKQVYAEVLALDAGKQKVQLPAGDTWPEGAYFYHLQAGESLQSGRLVKLQ